MVPNKILERIRSGEKPLGAYSTVLSEEIVELCGRVGLDFIGFDGQHGAVTPASIGRMCRVADCYGITPYMRVPDIEESTLLSYLDRGIKMVTAANIETKEQAESLVRYCKFAPEGLRSFTSHRVAEFGLYDGDPKTLMAETNANTMVLVMFESATALENLDAILSVPGIDYYDWGPMDLSQSLGVPGEPNHPRCVEAKKEGNARIHAAGKKLFSEVTEQVNLSAAVGGAAKELLGKHGR